MVLISIIIPTYNEEKYIGATLKLLKRQKYDGGYEIIVSDNSSADSTIRIATKYADKIVFVKKRGTGPARNAGAKHAKGKYLIFLDADTILPDGYLNEIHRIFEQERYVGFCGAFKFSNRSLRYKITEKCVNFYFIMMGHIGKTIIPGFSFCIPRSIFKRIGGFKNVFIEDVDLFKKLNGLGKTKYFTHFHVITSSRRLEKMGLLGTLDYYCDIKGRWNGMMDFSKRYVKVN